jgi:anti-sigma-K factor RskA
MTDPTSPADPVDPGDLDSLLGAYALDAIDADDRARVDAYLETDDNARAEVDDMRETAASLAMLPDSPMDAPPELWTRISQSIGAERAPAIAADRSQAGTHPAHEPVDELAARRSRRARWVAPVAAVAAIAVILLAVQVVSLHGRLDTAHQVGPKGTAAAFDRAIKAKGAQLVGLRSGSGFALAEVVLLPGGAGYLRGDHLAPLPPNQTYQLWAVTGSKTAPIDVSAGVLGPNPTAVAFHASGPVRGFAMTVEVATGVVKSHQQPVASGELS